MNTPAPMAADDRPAWGCLDVEETRAVAAGDPVEPGVRQHLSRCSDCRRAVQELGRELRHSGVRYGRTTGVSSSVSSSRSGGGIWKLLFLIAVGAAGVFWLIRQRKEPAPVTAEAVAVPAVPLETPEPPPARRARGTRATRSDAPDIVGTLRRNQAGVRICYERALKRDRHLSPRLDVDVSVSATGAVENVSIDGPRGLGELSSCVRNTIKTWQFPSAREPYRSRFPLLLQPSPTP
jgi:hypothetical protein